MYIVKLQDNCWLAPWKGDPGRTTVEKSAKVYSSKSAAKRALTRAKKIRSIKNAEIIKIS